MRWVITGAVIVALAAWGGFAGVAQAEIAGPAIQTQGSLTGVNVDSSTFAVLGPAGTQEFHATTQTVFYAGTERIDFGRLPEFIGVGALVWSAPVESEQIAGIVTLLVYPVRGTVAPGFSVGGVDKGDYTIGGGGGGGGYDHGNGQGAGKGHGSGEQGDKGWGHGEGGNGGNGNGGDNGNGGEHGHGR